MESKNEKKGTFIGSAMIFMGAGIFIKIIGAVNKIILGQESFLGEIGTGYIAIVYPYYNFFLMIAVAGIPSAVAKIVSEYNARGEIQEKENFFKLIKMFMAILGFALGIIFFIITPFIINGLKWKEAIYAMRAINISIFIVPYMASYRGYFQGHKNLKPFAASQMVEQIGKVVFGIVFALMFFNMGLEYSAAGAMLGVAIGAIFGVILLMYSYSSFKSKQSLPKPKKISFSEAKPLIKKILYYAIPMTIGASVVPLVDLIDGIMVKMRLMDMGLAERTAKIYYSYHSYYSETVANFPVLLFVAMQVSILPTVSSLFVAGKRKELEKTINTGLKITLIMSLGAGAGLFVLAKPVLMLLWPSMQAMHDKSEVLLKIMSIAIVFASIYQCTSGILQGMGLHIRNALNLLTGAFFKAFSSFFLIAIPVIGIKGASISNMITFFVAGGLNLLVLRYKGKVKVNILSIVYKPLIAAFIMGVCVHFIYSFIVIFMPNFISTGISVLSGAIIYLVLILLMNTLNKSDLEYIPGKKILSKFVK